jgi:hypothetical protein
VASAAGITNAKEYEEEFEMKLGSLSVRVNKPEPPGFKQFDVLFLIRAVPIRPLRITIIIDPQAHPELRRDLRSPRNERAHVIRAKI